MKKFAQLSVVLLASVASVPAFAQMDRAASLFDTADANHDGKISKAEFLAARDKSFDKRDTNHDGVISASDATGADSDRATRWLARSDSNGDGKVSRAELHASPTRFFDRADANGDGVVDKAERGALAARWQERHGT